jgi:CubicO group peptidase (beta-lactamase class C family)
LIRCRPDEVGVDSPALLSGIDDLVADRFELHSVMVAKAGNVICEKWWWPAGPDRPHGLQSATKSFVASAVGLAVAEGAIGLDTRVADVLCDDLPREIGDKLARVKVADLLTMRGGNAAGISGATSRKAIGSLVRAFLAEPLAHEPGTAFTYSSASSHLLSAVVQRATGEKVADYLRPRLFEPIGIAAATWDEDPQGISTGGSGLRITSEELLRFGLLHLADGTWNGKQILPPGWVADASYRHVAAAHPGVWDGERFVSPPADLRSERTGYGYHFWVGADGSYWAYGAFGQLCIIDPTSASVVVVTAGVDTRMTGFPDAVRDRLLPVLRSETGGRPYRGQDAWQLEAAQPPADEPAREPQRDLGGRFATGANEQGIRAVVVAISGEGVLVVVDHERGEQPIFAPWSGWAESLTSVYGEDLHHSYKFTDEPVVSHARWADPTAIELSWWFPETAFRDTVELRVHGDVLSLDRRTNANSGPLQLPTLVAYRESPSAPNITSS